MNNDCDGSADNDLGGTTCGEGICGHTIDSCVDGEAQFCNPFDGASPESCDGLDNDGYGDPTSPVNVCSAPAGSVTNGDDCHDSNADVSPGTSEWHTLTYEPLGGGASFDYNCDSVEEKRWPVQYILIGNPVHPEPCEPYFTAGWLGAPPACGALGLYADSCTYVLAGCCEIVASVSYGWETQECQ